MEEVLGQGLASPAGFEAEPAYAFFTQLRKRV